VVKTSFHLASAGGGVASRVLSVLPLSPSMFGRPCSRDGRPAGAVSLLPVNPHPPSLVCMARAPWIQKAGNHCGATKRAHTVDAFFLDTAGPGPLFVHVQKRTGQRTGVPTQGYFSETGNFHTEDRISRQTAPCRLYMTSIPRCPLYPFP